MTQFYGIYEVNCRAFACKAGRLGLILSWVIPKT